MVRQVLHRLVVSYHMIPVLILRFVLARALVASAAMDTCCTYCCTDPCAVFHTPQHSGWVLGALAGSAAD